MPAGGPLRAVDRAILVSLLAALGTAPAYPAGRSMPRIPAMLGRCGLTVVENQQRRFGYPLHTSEDADRYLDSLYLPGLTDRRYRSARTCLRALARRGATRRFRYAASLRDDRLRGIQRRPARRRPVTAAGLATTGDRGRRRRFEPLPRPTSRCPARE